jgi:hypothetical protein
VDNHDRIFANAPRGCRIKVYAIRSTKETWQESLRGYCQEKLGKVWKVSLPVHEADDQISMTFYVSEYSPNVLLFYTASTNRRYENPIRRLIRHTFGFGPMWIGPKKYEALIYHFMDEFKPTLSRFFGVRSPIDTHEPRIRPSYQRTILWTADDGFETMSELKELYGIRPTSVFMKFNFGEFQFTRDGLFVLRRQNKETYDVLNDALSFVRNDEEQFSQITQKMKVEFDSLYPRRKHPILIPKFTTGSISLKKTLLTKRLVEQLVSSSENFEFISSLPQVGSFSWVATAIDKEKRSVFGISSNDKEIKLIPRTNSTFETFLDFYRQVLEKVDETAVLEPFDVRNG